MWGKMYTHACTPDLSENPLRYWSCFGYACPLSTFRKKDWFVQTIVKYFWILSKSIGCIPYETYTSTKTNIHTGRMSAWIKKVPSSRRYLWCNGYRRRKWTRRHELKPWSRQIAFHIALIPLGKVWIQSFSLQQWVHSRTDCFFCLGETDSLWEGNLCIQTC